MENDNNEKPTQELTVSPRNEMRETLEAINEKLKNIEIASQSQYKTSKIVPDLLNQKKVDISECTDIPFLVNALASIKMHKAAYDEVQASVLQLKTLPVFKSYNGHTYEEWEHDIKFRVSILMQEETVKKLKEAKERLEKFLTNDDRLAIVLGEIKELGL